MRSLVIALLFATSPVPALAAPASVPDDAAVARHSRTLLHQAVPDPAHSPGLAVLVARGDRVVYRDARGMANIELGVPLSADHAFRIGSVTKQFAAAGVLKLAAEGRLGLDDPLERFVPGYPDGGRITLRMLLNHTSGVRSYTDIPGLMDGQIQRDVTTAQLIASFRDQPPDFAPGEGWRYSNSGYVLLGAVIEAASGMPWHAYLHQALFQPLQLQRTGHANQADALVAGHVTGYTPESGTWTHARYMSMTQPHAAGGLASTLDDLLAWNRALHGGGAVDAGLYRQMVTPAPGAREPYGFGILRQPFRGTEILQHGGGIFGFLAHLAYVPSADLSVIVLYNADGTLPPMPGTAELAHRIAAHALGKPYAEKVAVPLEPAQLAAYEGVYRTDPSNARQVRVDQGHLTLRQAGGPVQRLLPVGQDQFLFETGLSRLGFERDAAGAVAGLRLYPDDEGPGEHMGRTDEPLPAARVTVELPAAALERVLGRYALDGLVLTVAVVDGKPTAQLTGYPPLDIHAESPDRFFLTAIDATLEFTPGPDPADAVTVAEGGNVTRFTRLAE